MAISKDRKVELVAQYVEQLRQSKGIVLADYRRMRVSDISRLRNSLRSAGCRFWVVKNRLLKLALKETGLSLPDDWLEGPTVVGFCQDIPRAAKILTEATKELEMLRIKGGLVGSAAVSAEQVSAIANLPPLEVILSQTLGTINAPAARMVGVIAGGIRQILNVLQAYVDKQKSEAVPGVEQATVPA